MARIKKKNGADAAPMTTSQMLGSLLKSARDIMRKDKGLNGDLTLKAKPRYVEATDEQSEVCQQLFRLPFSVVTGSAPSLAP